MPIETSLSESVSLFDAFHSPEPFVIDVGGEGRHEEAWNVNPSRVRTFGPFRGQPIPRLILGRSDAIPLPNHCVDKIIVERTPLLQIAVFELQRIARPRALIILRHARPFGTDPHQLARKILLGECVTGECKTASRRYQETIILLRPAR